MFMARRCIGWIYLPHSQVKIWSYPFMCSQLIIKGRLRSRELFGKEMHEIVIPYNKEQLEYFLKLQMIGELH